IIPTLCFATRFQTIWEKMEFPVDTILPTFVYGCDCSGIGGINGDGYADFLTNKMLFGDDRNI
ncbi:MAG: hypothetical protein N3A65_05375, partial [candidate division WOR-3 bacterium]|nr:hypothetical protein [candidate division WOR-3 bacterium]